MEKNEELLERLLKEITKTNRLLTLLITDKKEIPLTEREKIELKKFALSKANSIMPDENFSSTAKWIDFKSKDLYKWLTTSD